MGNTLNEILLSLCGRKMVGTRANFFADALDLHAVFLLVFSRKGTTIRCTLLHPATCMSYKNKGIPAYALSVNRTNRFAKNSEHEVENSVFKVFGMN